MTARLDEDGRCVMTGLRPAECACKDHRNSPEVDAVSLAGNKVVNTTYAQYNGRCGIDASHEIAEGDEIFLVGPADSDALIGWACTACGQEVLRG